MEVKYEAPRDFLIRKGGYFYRPNAQGYTANPNEAGRFTFSEAWDYSHPNGEYGPRDGITFIHESDVDSPAATAQAEAASLRDRVAEVEQENAQLRGRLQFILSLTEETARQDGEDYQVFASRLHNRLVRVAIAARAALTERSQ